jgi:hypothetical protein
VKTLFLASIAALELFGASALASDLPTKAPVSKTPITASPYNWSGFYVGANFGGGWTNGSLVGAIASRWVVAVSRYSCEHPIPVAS